MTADPPAVAPPRRPWGPFLALLAVFVVLRVLHALTAVSSFDDEDGYTIAAAFELLQGRGWPYQTYLLSDWECGTFLEVLIAAPLCWLFGPSLFAVKLTGLLVSCVTLTGLFLLCTESHGPRAGLFACLLWVAFPAPIYTYSVTAHGFHPDSMAIQLFFLFWAVVSFERGRPRWRALFLLGALGGFAITFAYISIFCVAAVVLVRLLARRGHSGRWGRVAWLVPFSLGCLVGAVPLWVYNAINDARGFNVYHGALSTYVSLAGLTDKLRFFEEHTLRALRYFTNPFDPTARFFGMFELAFWALALPAALWPLGVRLARLLRRTDSAATAPGRHIDAVVPLVGAITLAVFFTSSHPVGPAHLVPLLVLMIVPLAGRLAWAWDRGRLAGRAVAALVLGAAVAFGAAAQVPDIRLDRLGVGLAVDGRNYPLFFFRALTAIEYVRDRRLEHLARDALLALPPELALDHEDFVHAPLAPAHHAADPFPFLRSFLRERPATRVRLDRGEAVGLCLARLVQKRRVTLDQALAFVASLDAAHRGPSLEVLAFYLGNRMDLLAPLRSALAGRPSLVGPMSRRVAFGMGRSQFLPGYFEAKRPLCGHERLPEELHDEYVRGVGRKVALRMIRPVPEYSDANVCAKRRAAFWQGVRGAPRPSSDKLGL